MVAVFRRFYAAENATGAVSCHMQVILSDTVGSAARANFERAQKSSRVDWQVSARAASCAQAGLV